MPATVTTRAGKGSPLTHVEVDANFTGLRDTANAAEAGLAGKQPLSAVLTATTASFTTADETKLDGIQAGATANAADAALRDRSTHTGNESLADGVELRIGTGNDLVARHDGTNSFLTSVTGTFFVQGRTDFRNAAGTETVAQFVPDDGVYFYFNNAARLWTTSGGVEVFGNIVVSGTVDGRDLAVDGAKLDGIAAGAQVNVPTDLTYVAASRTLESSTGADVVLPLVASGAAGLAPASGGGTTNFLRADGTWAAPAGGGGGGSYNPALGWAF